MACVQGNRRATAEVVAHRGASAYAPEHTFAAYDLALRQGAEALELDVRATADGELVVIHDPTLERTALDPRAVARLTRADLAALDPALRPLPLDAVLGRYGTRTRWLVELKDPAWTWEGAVAAALDRHGLRSHAVVQSFDPAALRRLHAAAPWLALAPLWERAPASRTLAAVARYAAGVGVRHGAVDAALVMRAHAAGLAVRAWTVNAPREMARLLALGVDGVITDRPDLARAAVGPAAALARAA